MDTFVKRWKRRSLTLPLMFALFVLFTLSAPLWILLGLGFELFSKRIAPIRFCTFLWAYVSGQVTGITIAFLLFVLRPLMGRKLYVKAHYGLQSLWAKVMLGTARVLFRLRFDVDGVSDVTPGPVFMLVRHVSVGDTLLGAVFAANQSMRLRYVLKRELLFDPCMDIVGQRLPNVFVDRSASSSGESKRVAKLASDLSTNEGVLIYPEGTRFTANKYKSLMKKLEEKKSLPAFAMKRARKFEHVLPPRTGGISSLLEAKDADVVILAHTGFECIEKLSDLWRRTFIGKTIHVRFWRIPNASIPRDDAQRTRWLYDTWADIDEWVSLAQDTSLKVAA